MQNDDEKTGREVSVGGYPFKADAGIDLPTNIGMMKQIAIGLDRVNETLPEESRFREITIYDSAENFKADIGGNRLYVGIGNFDRNFTQEELESILLHESGHAEKAHEYTFDLAEKLRTFPLKLDSDFTEECEKDRQGLCRRLIEEYDGRHGELIFNLDHYMIAQDRFIREAQAFCDVILKKPTMGGIFGSLMDEGKGSMKDRIDAIIHDMGEENKIEAEAKSILRFASYPESPVWPPFKSVENQVVELDAHELEGQVQEKLRHIQGKFEELAQSCIPLAIIGIALKHAEEIRADRRSVRYNEKHDQDGGRQAAPYELMQWLESVDAGREKGKLGMSAMFNGLSHPRLQVRAADMVNAAAGRYMEDTLMAGAPPEDAMALGTERAMREKAGLTSFPIPDKAIHPLNSPERTRGLKDGRTYAERLSAQKPENPHHQR